MRCSECNECIKYPSKASKDSGRCGKCRRGIDTKKRGRYDSMPNNFSLVIQ